MRKTFNTLKNFFLHFLFPRTCFCCGRDLVYGDAGPLCPACQKDLKPLNPAQELLCRRCGVALKYGGALCPACRKNKNPKCSLIRSGLKFTPASRALVHAFKYKGYEELSKFFAPFMHKAYQQNPEFFEADFLCPVPIHKTRRRTRGFNQAELLAQDFGRMARLPVLDVLRREVKTKSQTALGRDERGQNIKNAFTCAAPAEVKGKAVILVDDVCTTSATLEECARILRRAGAREVLAITAVKE